MRRWLLLLTLGAVVLPSMAAEPAIVLTAAQRQALGIRTGKTQAAPNLPLDGLPAVVRIPLNDSAVITAPYEGVVVDILAREGELVTREQPLARIRSRDAMTLGADLTAATGEYRVARAQAERDRQLLAEGIIPAARAQADYARRDAAAARLHELQAARALAPGAASGGAGTYELRAPIAGRVVERTLQLGESVAMLAKAYVIARGDQVMVELQVPVRYAASLRLGLQVSVAGGETGSVTEIGGAMHPASQTVRVRAEVTGKHLMIGQQTVATLMLPAPAGALRVPSAALGEQDGAYRLFVVKGQRFVPVPVTRLAQGTDGFSVVTGDIAPGTEVVVGGTGALKAIPLEGG